MSKNIGPPFTIVHIEHRTATVSRHPHALAVPTPPGGPRWQLVATMLAVVVATKAVLDDVARIAESIHLLVRALVDLCCAPVTAPAIVVVLVLAAAFAAGRSRG